MLSLAVLAASSSVVLLAGCATTNARVATDSSASPALVGLTVSTALQSSEPITDIAWDASKSVLWLVMCDNVSATLQEISGAGTKGDSVALPAPSDSQCPTMIKVSDKSDVWVAGAYTLSLYDHETRRVRSISLPVNQPGAIAGALDPNSELPGTWISALAPVDGGVVVARHNVPYLQTFTSSLAELANVPLPSGLVGPSDLLVGGGSALALGAFAKAARDSSEHALSIPGALMPESPTERWMRQPLLRDARYSDATGQVLWVDSAESAIHWRTNGNDLRWSLPTSTQTITGPKPAATVSPVTETVEVRPHLEAAARVDSHTVWLDLREPDGSYRIAELTAG